MARCLGTRLALLRTKQYSSSPHNFIHDTPHTPHVHPVVVYTVSEQALWRTVPSCRDVLCEWVLRVDTLTRAKVSQFQHILLQVKKQVNTG